MLEADPELGVSLRADQRPLALTAAVASVIDHPAGSWRLVSAPAPASLGFLILEGLIAIRTSIGHRVHLELLGEGDVIRPWTGVGPDFTIATVTASIVSDLRLAVLDRGFVLRTSRWPEIHASLAERMIIRARRANLQAAINAIPRIEERLDITLWQLANRFGRVTPDGVRLPLRLTHTQLAEIVAAQRPSVTMALTRLESSGRLTRGVGNGWLLHGPEPAGIEPPNRQAG